MRSPLTTTTKDIPEVEGLGKRLSASGFSFIACFEKS
jgi:hypothetical protein